MIPGVLLQTDLPLPLFIRGKVRDTYKLGDKLLIVATDRVSAFDVVLPCGVPGKGRVLNKLSAFWFGKTSHIIPNHLVEVVDDPIQLDKYLPPRERFLYPSYLAGRSMVVRKLARLPLECVVRGYLAGSGWAEYRRSGMVFGHQVPIELPMNQKLPEPIFTPTTKGEGEHDLPLTSAEVARLIGADRAREVEAASLALYSFARQFAESRGIIIADTKFEFGLESDRLVFIDEALTPDSSRFWDADLYRPGVPQDSFDKQPLRDFLESTGWNKEPPAPLLPQAVIDSTARRYEIAYERITGQKLE